VTGTPNSKKPPQDRLFLYLVRGLGVIRAPPILLANIATIGGYPLRPITLTDLSACGSHLGEAESVARD
jgi:hypothetical protein